MSHLHPATLRFLSDLARTNTRVWFEDNNERYQAARSDFEAIIDALIGKIAKFDPGVAGLTAKSCVFRIHRDTRFARDKTPYKTNFGAHIVAGGRQNEHGRAGYYIHVAPGDCFLAGGAHQPPAVWMDTIRREIAANGADLRRIVAGKSFRTYFGAIEGEQLKTAPRGYAKDHPQIDLLKYKSYLAVHRIAEKTITSAGFLSHAAAVFKALRPFDQFLNRGAD